MFVAHFETAMATSVFNPVTPYIPSSEEGGK
jgi:hypothetical protein